MARALLAVVASRRGGWLCQLASGVAQLGADDESKQA